MCESTQFVPNCRYKNRWGSAYNLLNLLPQLANDQFWHLDQYWLNIDQFQGGFSTLSCEVDLSGIFSIIGNDLLKQKVLVRVSR